MIDLHIHSNASDGTDSPEELLQKISESGINIFALTDHDTITGALKIRELIPENIKFVQGIEFSCITGSNSKCHILGLNYDENNKSFREAIKTGEDLRHAKFFRRIELLRDKFAITFTDSEIKNLLSIPSVGKPHIANMIIAKGFARTRPEAIENFIDKCRTGIDKISAELAINAIIDSGGVAVWAHPLGGEREPELPREKFIMTLDELISYGLNGLECYYSKYELAKCESLAEIAHARKLFISGGSDYHGKNKSIPLGRLNAENIIVDANKITILEIL
ncbi:MAG: PHP domain-containing protein [Synergistaceae bacterium]|nr:PHP domain-containing protein [Synergistaceae bacterium]